MMTKLEFIEAVRENLKETSSVEYTKKEANIVINTVLDTIASTLLSGKSINLTGLMKFQLVTVPEKSGVTALTGKEYVKPEHTKCKVTMASNIKKELEEVTIVE